MKKDEDSMENAQILAFKALEFLALDEDRFGRFLALSGATPATITEQMREPVFLCGVLDYLLGDETLLFEFCEYAQIPATAPGAARRHFC